MTRSAIPLTEAREALPPPQQGPAANVQKRDVATENLRRLLRPLLDQLVELSGAQAGIISILAPDGRTLLPWLEGKGCVAAPGGPSSLNFPLSHGGKPVGQVELLHRAASHGKDLPEPALSLIANLLALLLLQSNAAEERVRAGRKQESEAMLGEVHDVLAQSLSYARMRLPLLQDAILAQDSLAGLKHLAEVRQTVGDAHTGLRQLMSDFRSRSDPRGLANALQELALGMLESNDMQLEVRNVRPGLDLDDRQETQIFRIVQEAIANAAKHSGTRRATISIGGGPDELEVRIEDEGVGLGPSGGTGRPGLGLGLMRSRAQSLGGSIEIGNRFGGGTLVRLCLPLDLVSKEAGR